MKDEKAEAATFEVLAPARARVAGALGFHTVTALLPVGSAAIRGENVGAIDLSAVTSSDSAGLALLVEWLSVARADGRTLRYENVPAQLHQLGALSDVDGLIAAA